MKRVYLDDTRTPIGDWLVVRTHEELVSIVQLVGLQHIELISLDHDLGPEAMAEYFDNVAPNYALDYSRIEAKGEKTGMDSARWLVSHSMRMGVPLPRVDVHSANPIGSANIMGHINNYLMNQGLPQTCERARHPYHIDGVMPTEYGRDKQDRKEQA